ncbi:MAG: (2E,6E)-farnesyl diphosphate synthase [Bacteroidetes bacterium ADurb.Bin408]|nr:MAG: (2E,6E)-farnesyl diphosphate synthase [Bacteroidetes bacterium ADurb.Bin408]
MMLLTQQELVAYFTEALIKEKFDYKPVELFEPIEYTMSLGGKRIRPLMTLMACNMFYGNIDDALNPAIGLEVFHNFTLLHDDILDNAALRRGKETVFKKWNVNRAILSGDTMFALAYGYFFKTQQECILPILEIFNKTAIEVCQGQQYDMNFESADSVSIPDYMEMIRLKTAVLLGACVKIGSLIGHASEKNILEMYCFAEKLGVAFQLKDDVLDLYSNQEVFGKATGGDIAANKKTFLYLKALEMSDNVKRKELKELFKLTLTDNTEKISTVKHIYDQLNIREITEAESELYYQQAISHLDKVEIAEPRKEIFRAFAYDLMKRNK